MNQSVIRQEEPKDYPVVFELIQKAFKNIKGSNHQEGFLIEQLRKRTDFIPEFSLVAQRNEILTGHVLLSKITIKNWRKTYPSLALAPVSVLPEYQRQNIGSRLIISALKAASEKGFESVIVLGHPSYYPRFGFQPASKWQIVCQVPVPDEAFMALELKKGALEKVHGTVDYPPEFFE